MERSTSDNRIPALVVICIIAVILSSFNTYLILNNSRIQQEQLTKLQNDLNDAKDKIETLKSSLSSLNETFGALNMTELMDLSGRINQQTPAVVYEATYKSVVVIRTPLGQGSGFLYGDQNLIITNWHVVENETDIEVQFYDRTRVKATNVGGDPYADIAVIRVTHAPSDAKGLQLGNSSKLWIGEQVVAIGNPLGLTGSLSSGYISQINKLIDLPPLIVPVLELDITIAPGSSGGPLLDLNGHVVGITNAGTNVGFNFAVPSNIIKRAASSIIEKGYYRHPYVGFQGIELTPTNIETLKINIDPFQTGLLIWEVIPDTPAAKAGLKGVVRTTKDGSITYDPKDIILEVDGHPMYNFEDWSGYIEENVSPGQTITLTLWRSGINASVQVTTTNRPEYQ